MEFMPGEYSREEVMEATGAEILSDIRLLTITVQGSTEKFVREVQAAVESGLEAYAQDSEELKRIEEYEKAQAEIGKNNEKSMLQKMFKVV